MDDKLNKIYRVFDKKDKYQQSYSAKLKNCKEWAIDCATLVKGYVREDLLDSNGETKESKLLFKVEK